MIVMVDGYVAFISLIKMTRSMTMMTGMMMMMMQCSGCGTNIVFHFTSFTPAFTPYSFSTSSSSSCSSSSSSCYSSSSSSSSSSCVIQTIFPSYLIGCQYSGVLDHIYPFPKFIFWPWMDKYEQRIIFLKKSLKEISSNFLQGRTVDSLMCRQEDWSKGRIHFCSGWQVQLLSKRRHVICN